MKMKISQMITAVALAVAGIGTASAANFYLAVPKVMSGPGSASFGGAGNKPPADRPAFQLHANGLTVLCDHVAPGTVGQVNGVEYLAADDAQWHTEVAKTSGFKNLCTSHVTYMSGAGDISPISYEYLASVPISDWDTSNVTSMANLFLGASSFNQPLDAWDTSKVVTMNRMFQYALEFNQPIGGWDTSKVVTMRDMFRGAREFNQPIGGWDVSSVEDMSYMFMNAEAFNQPIGAWDTGVVSDMRFMFDGAKSFNQHIGNWNVGAVTQARMAGMFTLGSKLNQNLSCWNVSHIASKPMSFREPVNPAYRPRWGLMPNHDC